MAIRKELFNKIKEISNSGLEIMKGRDKGDIQEILNDTLTVTNYEFGKGEQGDYVVFIIKDNDTEFFFGSSVVTENFLALDNLLNEEEKIEIFNTGISMSIHQKKSKNNRNYTYNVFFPNN
ncbi:hypothetical protein [Romboutsia sp.]|uniref:hypothetical protein n=1 Tax=Romboutsia sp. TaxID=1965302 RepID=UPI003F39B104